jgi:hypothetical protein
MQGETSQKKKNRLKLDKFIQNINQKRLNF